MSADRLKRLRFAYDPAEHESVIGAFAAACHEQRLSSIRSGLEGAGVSLARPGSLQAGGEATLRKIAAAMRTDPAGLAQLAFGLGDQAGRIALGDLSLPRKAIDLNRRRIGPMSIRLDPRHRAEWLNLLLPYCPISLELLVDECPVCGPLGWRHTRGIGACEICGIDIPPVDAAPLASGDVQTYRLVADLLSRDGQVGDRAVASLPAPLRRFSRTTLAAVLVRAGTILGSDSLERPIERLLSSAPAVIARAVCAGMRLLQGWPHAIQQAVDRRTAEMGDDLTAYERLRADLRWMANASGQRNGEESHVMLATAFPTLDGRTAEMFARAGRYYTATETTNRLWISSSELDVLRDARAIRHERLPSNRRIRARYDADDVDELAALLVSGETPATAASRLDLPIYALGQMTQWLRVHDERGVVALRGPQVGTSSVERLRNLIREAGGRDRPAGDLIRLETALARFPGEKPWCPAVRAMLSGDLPFHLPDDEPRMRSCLVAPDAVTSITGGTWPSATDAFAIDYLSLRDAYDVLSAGRDEALAAIAAARIDIVNHRKGKAVARNALAQLVAEVAFPREVATVTGRSAMSLYFELPRLGVPRIGGAWSRASLVALGMVQSYDPPEAMVRRALTDADLDARSVGA